jgi:hypothetical protein
MEIVSLVVTALAIPAVLAVFAVVVHRHYRSGTAVEFRGPDGSIRRGELIRFERSFTVPKCRVRVDGEDVIVKLRHLREAR